MNYLKIHDTIINNAKKQELNEYCESHHIIPKCLGGNNDINNIVKLKPREHYIIHGLLVKIYKNDKNISKISKLICAFRYMSVDSHNGKRTQSKNKDYGWMRKLYSIHHPMKLEENKNKIRIKRIKCICECGCGNFFIKKINSEQKYIHGHQGKIINNNPIIKKKHDDNIKKYLSLLTKEQHILRMKKSVGSCDQIKRGKAISLGKKGKSTNQSKIEQERYGKMTNKEFKNHIKDRKLYIKKRMVNKRMKYLNE